ncbi:hypothetical protein DAT35_00665 [Vitiosangium sp. GDMCC 1.1324]|nr:hypothetical protein DAT35_00665 [Vitiosangium sp. GDMCC 1.1324]
MGRLRPAITDAPRRGWLLAPQAEALALLDQLASPDHLPEGALELGLLPGVQLGESEQILDAERMLGLRQVSPYVLKKVGHESSQNGEPDGP